MTDERLKRNIPAISETEQEKLRAGHACIVGCGGLGGCSIEYLARIGVGRLTVIDGDRFEASNRNRQLLSVCENEGSYKAEAAGERIRSIFPETQVQVRTEYLTEENAETLLNGADVVLDALDSAEARLILSRACKKLGIPLVHGAVQGWNAQIAVVFPESETMEQLYRDAKPSADKSCLSFTPALCAAIQCSEAVKLLSGRETALRSRLLTVDLRDLDFETVPLL